jgi:hypothetical protein
MKHIEKIEILLAHQFAKAKYKKPDSRFVEASE